MDTYEIWNSFKTHIYPFVAYQKATQLVFETKTFCNMVEFSFLLLEVVYFYNANTLLALLVFIICGWKKLEIKKHYPLIALCYKWRKFYIFVSAIRKYSNFISIRFFCSDQRVILELVRCSFLRIKSAQICWWNS